jgi:hypothetical protein
MPSFGRQGSFTESYNDDCIAFASMLFLVFHKEEKVNEKRVKKRSRTTPHKVPSFTHTLGFFLFISKVVAGEQTNGILL